MRTELSGKELCDKRQNLSEGFLIERLIIKYAQDSQDYREWMKSFFIEFSFLHQSWNSSALSNCKPHYRTSSFVLSCSPTACPFSLIILLNMGFVYPSTRLKCVSLKHSLSQAVRRFIDAKLKNLIFL